MGSDTTQPTFAPGEILAGKYRVERMLGEGGMGVVLEAEHLALHQKVAIKLLRTAALGHTDVVGRFMREARAAVRLRSEHVARVLDVGSLDDGRPFIVMERLEGDDLGEVVVRHSPLPVHVAVDYVLQACEAIAEAHAAGIIHRDLKPKNLFLTQTVHGRPLVKVLDFGISKVDPAHAPQEMQLTKTAEVIGSPSYMSPEQLRSSRNVDARTDIWALGVILYELLTGRVPFNAETVTELVVVVVTEPAPPVQSLRPDVPEGLAQIVARCLQKPPELRFQSVLELVQALEPYAQGHVATAAERVRAVAAVANTAPLPAASSPPGQGPFAPPASPSSRVNVHGGTSVAWGETQSQVGPMPVAYAAPVKGSRAGLVAALVAGGLVIAGTAAGGAAYYVRRSTVHAPPAAATGEGTAMPLPPGRKDLPPLTPAPPPPPEPPTASASAQPEPPAPSTLPTTRKPATKRPPSRPPAPKPDDLDNIGRR